MLRQSLGAIIPHDGERNGNELINDCFTKLLELSVRDEHSETTREQDNGKEKLVVSKWTMTDERILRVDLL